MPSILAICALVDFASCQNSVTTETGQINQICINESIQSTFDSLLVNRLKELKTEAVFGAVMEVSTGNLVAISSWENLKGSVIHIQNNMFLQIVDPGSVFQAVTYTALLETVKLSPDSLVDTGNLPDNLSFFNYHGKEVCDEHPVGIATAKEALAQGSNIATVKMVSNAFDENPKEYLDAIAKLGWYETPFMVFNGDTLPQPRIRTVHDATWSKVSLGQISCGYEMNVTPMHTLMFFNSIANDGVRPSVGRICSDNTARQVKEVLENTAGQIAGKTGSAQIFANGTYASNGHNVTFVGYFPAEKPKYSCFVTLKVAPDRKIYITEYEKEPESVACEFAKCVGDKAN